MPDSLDNNAAEPAKCCGCGYRLDGLSRRRCPECGKVDPTVLHPPQVGAARLWGGVAAAAISLECGLILMAVAAAGGEPFRTMKSYLATMIKGGLSVGAGIALFGVAVGVAVGGYVGQRRRTALALRIFAGWSFASLLPVMASAVAIAAQGARSGWFDLTYETKPSWIESKAVDVAASPFILVGLVVAAGLHAWIGAVSHRFKSEEQDGRR